MLSVVMLNVIMLNVNMLRVIFLSVVMLNVAVPYILSAPFAPFSHFCHLTNCQVDEMSQHRFHSLISIKSFQKQFMFNLTKNLEWNNMFQSGDFIYNNSTYTINACDITYVITYCYK
jgi:hypothetical protein